MDRLDAMRLFVRVAELGSFAAVAKQLGVARSVVTRQVAGLEAHLGAKLMVRSTRSLSLTSAGTAYLEKCRVILNLVDSAETDVAQERAVARGHIRMGLPLSFGLRRLAPLLLDFAELHPAVSLEMDYTDRRVDLVEEGFDLSIRITSRIGLADVVRKLGTCRMVTVAAPGYLARHGRPTQPSDLSGHECLAYAGDANPGAWSFTVAATASRTCMCAVDSTPTTATYSPRQRPADSALPWRPTSSPSRTSRTVDWSRSSTNSHLRTSGCTRFFQVRGTCRTGCACSSTSSRLACDPRHPRLCNIRPR